MVTVGVLARFEVLPEAEAHIAAFFREGLPLVEAQPTSTLWFAYRISDLVYGAFAAFANEQDREALLAAGGPQLSEKYRQLFVSAPTFERLELLEARVATPPMPG